MDLLQFTNLKKKCKNTKLEIGVNWISQVKQIGLFKKFGWSTTTLLQTYTQFRMSKEIGAIFFQMNEQSGINVLDMLHCKDKTLSWSASVFLSWQAVITACCQNTPGNETWKWSCQALWHQAVTLRCGQGKNIFGSYLCHHLKVRQFWRSLNMNFWNIWD